MPDIIINNVAKYRLKYNLTQEDLALKVSVSRQTIIALEKGNYTPSVLLALKIAKVFKTELENIFTITYEK